MTGVDYDALALIAENLIKDNGRQITMFAEPRTKADTARPWRGPITDVADPDYVAPAELPIFGVFAPPNQVRIFNLSSLGKGTEFIDMLAFSEQIIIAYPQEVDLTPYNAVLDDGSKWGVTAYQQFKPGPKLLLTFIGVRR